MAFRDATSRLREGVWNGSIPLEIRLHKADCRTYDESDPYLVSMHSLYICLVLT
jgi:autophagy-related protein 5